MRYSGLQDIAGLWRVESGIESWRLQNSKARNSRFEACWGQGVPEVSVCEAGGVVDENGELPTSDLLLDLYDTYPSLHEDLQ